MIGPDGGSVTTTDGKLTLTVPAGALSETVNVRIAPIPIDQAPAAVQALAGELTIYDLQPAGLQFASPAELAATVPDARTSTDAALELRMAFLLAESENVVEGLSNQTYAPSDSGAADAVVTADIEHFSSAIVQFFEGATFSATVPAVAAVGEPFDVTVTTDIDGAGLGVINQAVQEDASAAPVVAGDPFNGAFAGTATIQTSTNAYSCTGGGSGLYRTIVGFEVDNDLGLITAATLAKEIECSQSFEIANDRPGDIGRAEGSPIAAYSTGPGVTVINIATGEVLQRVTRTDENEFGFPTSGANVYAPDAEIRAVIATTTQGVDGAFLGDGELSAIPFIPPESGGNQNLQYAPGRFASIGGTAHFFDIGMSGPEEVVSLSNAFDGAGELRLRTAYVQPQGFDDGFPMLAIRTRPNTNPAVDPPDFVRLSLDNDAVVLDLIEEEVPLVLELPLGQVRLRCLPDPEEAQNAICGIAALGGGISLFRWIPAELPNNSIRGIAGSAGGSNNFLDIDLINTSQGTRFATTSVTPEVRLDDVETGLSGSGLTTQTIATPGECGTAVAVEFRSENSLLLSCSNIDFVVTLDLPPFGDDGAGGAGGMGGGTGGTGGTGGMSSCTDDIGARPTLTAQPTITPMDGVEGGQVEVGVAVSAEARVVKAAFFDGSSDPGGEATMATAGSESLTLTIDLTEDASAFDYFLAVVLCNEDNLDCTTNSNTSSVSYIRGTSTAQPGEPYFVSVRDDGASIPAVSTESCFDILAIKIAAP